MIKVAIIYYIKEEGRLLYLSNPFILSIIFMLLQVLSLYVL